MASHPPLKESERRADKWRQATGVQQTAGPVLMAASGSTYPAVSGQFVGSGIKSVEW
jgi:hypothetical protein